MADYYPLIARAVAGLEKNTGDSRRSLYERARTALVAQLRGVTPALSESDITRERLALEEAIRKVEAESARQTWVEPARAEPVQQKVRPPEMPKWEDLPLASGQGAERTTMPRTESLRRPQGAPRQQDGLTPNTMFGSDRYVDPVFDKPLSDGQSAAPQPATPQQRHPLRGRASGERRSLLDAGLNDFRNVVSETNELGEASARSARSARELYDEGPAPELEYERRERGSHEADDADMVHDAPAPRLLEPSIDDETQPMPARVRMPPMPVEELEDAAPRRSFGDYIKIVAILLVVVGLGVGLFLLWPTVSNFYASLRGSPTDVASETPVQSGQGGRNVKDPGRFDGSPQQSQQSPQTAAVAPGGAAVAQRVVLYEE